MSDKIDNQEFKVTNHILPTSANLLGICFVILSFIKTSNFSNKNILDEWITVPILAFFISSILSYISIRNERGFKRLERFADYFFLLGLISLTLISIMLTVDTWKVM